MEKTGKKIVFDLEHVNWRSDDLNAYTEMQDPKSGAFMTSDGVIFFVEKNGMVISLVNMNVPYEVFEEMPQPKEQEHSVREQFALDLVGLVMRGGEKPKSK